MTRVLITGAAGFLGRRLADALAAKGNLVGPSGEVEPISELVLTDIAQPSSQPSGAVPVTTRQGDLADPDFLASLAETGFDSLFHLASLLTLEAETDPWRAFEINVNALRRLMEDGSGVPRVVFPSSIAIHGGDLPEIVGDDLDPTPATTYGTHKAINELMIADYTRLGRVNGRSLRLPIVVTRPGTPVASVSDMIAGIIREPLDGIDIVLPLAPETTIPVVSGGAVASALIRTHELDDDDLPPKRAFNLPALTVTVAELVAAVKRHGGRGVVSFEPNPQVQTIIDGWPRRFVSGRAERLAIGPDADLDALIADYLEHEDD